MVKASVELHFWEKICVSIHTLMISSSSTFLINWESTCISHFIYRKTDAKTCSIFYLQSVITVLQNKKKTQNLTKQRKQLTLLPILWNNNDLEIPSLTQPYKT